MTAKTLMIQGCGSGVGKSIITAALCRCFYKDGMRVAPFKAQNMALNSFITIDGGEIGRAQAFQAQACGIEPRVEMNPILLKPCGENLSQVVVMGKAVGNRNAKDYYAGREKYRPEALQAFATLSQAYDLIVIEGAGSPAEINLRDRDMANMFMAKTANAPVIIVGDIDHGGVFAWMKGTYDLLTPDEQKLVCGFVINKFRGDIEILKPGLDQFEQLVGKPILGVLPYFRDLFVDEEDSLPLWNRPVTRKEASSLDVAVIWFPRMANFTDLSPLALDPSLSLRYVSHPGQLGNPDLIILPGSKNTPGDMLHLKSQGFDEAVHQCRKNGSIILGICGGFQMMGRKILDPNQIEGNEPDVDGLSFFDYETTIETEKVTRQVQRNTLSGPVFPEGLTVEGYEIHMGKTPIKEKHNPLFASVNGEELCQLGLSNPEGTLIGTYLHGFLDNDILRKAFLKHVYQVRGLPVPQSFFDYGIFRETQLDRLEKLVRDSIDIEQLKKIINEA